MADEQEFLNALVSGVKSLDMKVQFLGKEIAEVKSKKQELPTYFGSREQIVEELEAQHFFTKDQPGIQDDIDKAFRMFTQTTPGGDLLSGLVNEHGQPASLMEMYKTMDLRGVVWNYFVGWGSALKGGWNSAIATAEDNAKKTIKEIYEKCVLEPNKSRNVLDYLKSTDDLEYYIENRERLKENERSKLYPVEKILKRKIYYGRRKDGKPRSMTVEWVEGKELPPIFLEGEISPRKLQEIKQYSFTD